MAKKTSIQKRLEDSHIDIIVNKGKVDDALFQHSVLCQTFLPYRNPGKELRIWKHQQGRVRLAIQANEVLNPQKKDYEFIGLPYGAKARLILSHINSEAIRTQSPVINVEDSMTAFIRKMGLPVAGRTISQVKNQLMRLTTSIFSLGYLDENKAIQVDLKILKAFDIWFPKDEKQRVLWSSKIQLTDDYFNSLLAHAIPLDMRALASLSNNAMALDIYAWLAQRLHRVNPKQPQFVTWADIKNQFGQGYTHMYKFKQVFRKTLKIALLQYPSAHIREEKNKGFWLSNSPSPIEKKTRLFISG